MRCLPACLLTVGLFAVGCNDRNRSPTVPSGESKPSGETKVDPKEILAALRQLGEAFHKFEEKHGNLPAAVMVAKDGRPLLSWRVAVLPFIGQGELYQQFHLEEPWDSEHNKKLLEKMPKVYAPVRGPAPKEPASTYYQVFTGPGAPFSLEARNGPKLADFADGTSQTLLIVEASEAVAWTKPADLVYEAQKPLPTLGFGDRVYVVLADGSPHFIKRTVPETLFRAAVTPNGNERDVLISDERNVLDKD